MKGRLKLLWSDVRVELRRAPWLFPLTLWVALVLVPFAVFDENFEADWEETKGDE